MLCVLQLILRFSSLPSASGSVFDQKVQLTSFESWEDNSSEVTTSRKWSQLTCAPNTRYFGASSRQRRTSTQDQVHSRSASVDWQRGKRKRLVILTMTCQHMEWLWQGVFNTNDLQMVFTWNVLMNRRSLLTEASEFLRVVGSHETLTDQISKTF